MIEVIIFIVIIKFVFWALIVALRIQRANQRRTASFVRCPFCSKNFDNDEISNHLTLCRLREPRRPTQQQLRQSRVVAVMPSVSVVGSREVPYVTMEEDGPPSYEEAVVQVEEVKAGKQTKKPEVVLGTARQEGGQAAYPAWQEGQFG